MHEAGDVEQDIDGAGDIGVGVVEMPDRITVAPVVADGSVYFLADDAQLVAYR